MDTITNLLKTVICDDHPIVLQGLSAILIPEKGFEIQCLTQNGEDLIQAVLTHTPDVVLVDANLKNELGFDLITKINQQIDTHYRPKSFIITSYMDEYMVARALKVGATGCISKSLDADSFIHAIKFPKVYNVNQISEVQSNPIKAGLNLLTQREKDIIRLMTMGHASKKIAEQLCISNYTVETHKKNIFRKLKFNSATELLAWFFANKDLIPTAHSHNFD
jgi:two-component system nitrate/nitrite response regulator NarL